MATVAPPSCSPSAALMFVLFYTNITSRFFSESDVLELAFNTPTLCNANFSLELWHMKEGKDNCNGMNGQRTHKEIVQTQIPTTVAHLSGPFLPGFHCIRVRPLKLFEEGTCRRGCNTVSDQIYINVTVPKPIFRHRRKLVREKLKKQGTDPKDDVPDCNNWNATVSLQPNLLHSNLSLTVAVSVLELYENCFSYLNICLWFDAIRECDSLSGRQVDHRLLNGNHGEVIFTNITPGNYCVRMHASHPSCGEDGCSPLYSNIQAIYNRPLDEAEPQEIRSANYALPWVYSFLVVGVILFVLMGYIVCKKKRNQRYISDLFPDKDVSEVYLKLNKLVDLAKESACNREVVLLYSPDFPEHCDLMLSLCSFLNEACGFLRVFIDINEEHDIAIDLYGWITRMMNSNPNRRILIVESEGAVLQEEGRTKVKLVRRKPEMWDCLDQVFPNALQVLKERSHFDYANILVLRFPYTVPENFRLKSFVPDRRFFLPQHLFELYWALLDLRKQSVSSAVLKDFEKRTVDHWRTHPRAVDLLQAISRAETKMRENPDIVRNTFVEEPLFHI